MKNKLLSFLFFLLTIFISYSCSDHVIADFSYSPTMPVRGQTVTFTNLSTGDEDWKGKYWNWNFGDDSKSVSETAYHTYKTAGIFTVTLRVDSNNNYVCKKQITVYDSVPTIYVDDTVKYYQKVNFSVLAYNPYSEDVTYDWIFSENAHSDSIVDGKSTAATMSVYFSKPNVNEIVQLHITVGDSEYNVADTLFVYDVKAKSLLMTQKNGNVLRQRIYDLGLEEPSLTAIPSGKHSLNFVANSGYAYLFDAGSSVAGATVATGDGSIKAINLTNDNVETVATNTNAAYTFFTGSVDKNYIYWGDNYNYAYKLPKTARGESFDWVGDATQTQKSYYLVRANRIGYYGNGLANGQLNGGIANFDQAYFWAKGGTGKGLYRFLASDILAGDVTGTGTSPTLGVILKDYAIRAFAIDEINSKVYFSVTAPSDKIGLWVANLNGTGAQLIDNAPMDDEMLYITGIVVDNVSNKVYWAYRSPETVGNTAPTGTWSSYYESHPTHRTGVKMAQLATSFKAAGSIEYFALGVESYGIALDDVLK